MSFEDDMIELNFTDGNDYRSINKGFHTSDDRKN